METGKYKVNLHILEPCNLHCKHCFSHFGSKKILSFNDWKQIVDNCIDSGIVDSFNIAGGEPLLHPDLENLIQCINGLGTKCSIITNGTLVTPEWIKRNAKYLETIGFSVDSFNPDTLRIMGRINANGEYLSLMDFCTLYSSIKENNPECKMKLNTVVSSLNKEEKLAKIIQEYSLFPDKWKILKMRKFENENFSNSSISISEEEYERYVERNLEVFGVERKKEEGSEVYEAPPNMKIVVEKELAASYLIIDSNGSLLDNSVEGSHVTVANCLETPFEEAFRRLKFNQDLYLSRY